MPFPTAERIVAIGLGKYKSVACDYCPNEWAARELGWMGRHNLARTVPELE